MLFQRFVMEEFAYIKSEYHLNLQQTDEDIFLINANVATIKILLTKGHNYDINITIAPTKDKNVAYGIKTLLDFLGKKHNLTDNFQGPSSLLKLIKTYAEAFRSELLDLILNNKINWKEVSNYAKKQVIKKQEAGFTKDRINQINKIRNEAMMAFKKKKYADVVQLLTVIRNDLSPSDQKKFDYALNKCVFRKS